MAKDKRALTDEFRAAHIIDLQGKEFVTFDGLIALAHDEGDLTPIRGIETNLERIPDKVGELVVIKATVIDKNGGRWTGTGDADAFSVGKNIAKHGIRMAETRAIGRALRMMLGIGTMVEELDQVTAMPKLEGWQVAAIGTIMKERNITKELAFKACQQKFGRTSVADLNREEANQFIVLLEGMVVPAPLDDVVPEEEKDA
jgi:hypothetical protein